MSDDGDDDPPEPPFAKPPADPMAAGMRARIAERMFGEASSGAAQQIGRFVVRGLLGSGGMGIVYEADDPLLLRVVALKVLKDAAASSASQRERIVREARVLASLSHPRVVGVHEVGEHEGQVFIVMERVDGVGLNEWQQAQPRKLRDIVRVYLEAAKGLRAAHDAGFVHRDFKPSNVLIAEKDGVRVADFGLARTVHGAGGLSASSETTSGRAVEPTSSALQGTPAYMAPEQVIGGLVDERSDQFSFCMALWEATFGARPWEPGQIVQMAAYGKPPQAPATRRNAPRWLRRALLRGLSISPAHRWPSMTELSAALERGLGHRRRVVLGTSTVGLILLAGAAYENLIDPCQRAEEGLVGAWDPRKATALQSHMEAITPFAADVLPALAARLDEYAESWVSARLRTCEATYVAHDQSEEQFDRAVACLDRARSALEIGVQVLIDADADALAQADAVVDGLPSVTDCGNTLVLRDGPAPAPANIAGEVAQIQRRVDEAAVLLGTGQADDAAAIAATASQEATELGYVPMVAESRLAAGLSMAAKGDVEAARATLFESATAAMASRHHRVAVSAWHRLVQMAATDLENGAQAREWNALAGSALAVLGDQPLLAAEHRDYDGIVASAEHDLERAVELHREAATAMREVLPADDLRVIQIERRVANTLLRLGRVEEARTRYLELEEQLTQRVGRRHPEFARVQHNLGLVAKIEGDYVAARTRFERVLSIMGECFGEDSMRVAPALTSLAELDLLTGNLDAAHAEAERAWRIQRNAFPIGHSERASPLALLAEISLQQRSLDLALEQHMELAAEFADGAQKGQLGEVYQNIAWILCELDRCTEAHSANRRTHELASPGSPLELYAEVVTARIELAEGNGEASLVRLRRLLPKAEALEGSDHPELVPEIEWSIARAMVASGAAAGDARVLRSIERALDGYSAAGSRPDAVERLTEMRSAWLKKQH